MTLVGKKIKVTAPVSTFKEWIGAIVGEDTSHNIVVVSFDPPNEEFKEGFAFHASEVEVLP